MNEPPSVMRPKGLKVSELAQQLWCEKRVELELLYGKEDTKNMKIGRERHRELFEEITPVIEVKPETLIDEFFLICYQMWSLAHMAKREGIAREVPVFGKVDTFMVKGVIDEILIHGNASVLVETKTRASGTVPDYRAYTRVVQFQLSLYKKMLDDIMHGSITYTDILTFYKIGPDAIISNNLYSNFPKDALFTKNAVEMAFYAFEAVKTLPETADTMVVRYEDQNRTQIGEHTFIYDTESLQRNLDFVLEFWKGKRKAAPALKNLWKCNYCPEQIRNRCSEGGEPASG